MGWIISVGKAGAKGRMAGAQAVSLRVELQGVAVYLSAWQAQRVWQNVLSTLVQH
jgi:hypothetical protein